MGRWAGYKARSPSWWHRFTLAPSNNHGEGDSRNFATAWIPQDFATGHSGRRRVQCCLPWTIAPTYQQRSILYLIAAMTIVICIGYQFSITRMILYPFSIISTIFHEFGHALVCLLTGGQVKNIEINMNESGMTRFVGGWYCAIVPAGYIGSSFTGAILLFMGFSQRWAKHSSIAVMIILAATIYWASSSFTFISSLVLLAMMLGAYLWQDGLYTRHFILFLSTCASLESLLNILGSTVWNTIKGSDAYEFSRHCSIILPAFVFGLLWLLISAALIASAVCLALVYFKE